MLLQIFLLTLLTFDTQQATGNRHPSSLIDWVMMTILLTHVNQSVLTVRLTDGKSMTAFNKLSATNKCCLLSSTLFSMFNVVSHVKKKEESSKSARLILHSYEQREWFDMSVQTKPLHRRETSESKGRHLVSTQKIEEGQIIFVERPLLSLQSFGNSHTGALVCKRCRAFVGGPDISLGVASGRISREDIWDHVKENGDALKSGDASATLERIVALDDGSGSCKVCVDEETFQGYDTSMVPCRHGCGEIFCSLECEENSWLEGGHDLLCTGLIPDSENAPGPDDTNPELTLHPLLQFKIFAIQNNEIFLMVADLVASVVSRRRRQIAARLGASAPEIEDAVNSLETMMHPYLDFTLEPWWDVATKSTSSNAVNLDRDTDENSHYSLSSNLRQLCREASSLLKDAILSISQFRKSIGECEESDLKSEELFQDTLNQAIDECADHYDLFSEEFFGKIIGSFEQNAMGIRARHPLCRDILENIGGLRERCHDDLVKCLQLGGILSTGRDYDDTDIGDENMEQHDDMNSLVGEYTVQDIQKFISELFIDEDGRYGERHLEKEDEHDSHKGDDREEDDDNNSDDEGEVIQGDDLDVIFTPLDGTAMYYTACKMNHSCHPNVIVRYTYSCSGGGNMARWGPNFPLVVQCTALRDIEEGDELCISYIQNDMSLDDRQEALENYGFTCNCSKCMNERTCKGESLKKACVEGEGDLFNHDCEDDDIFGEDSDDDEDNSTEKEELDTYGADSVLFDKVALLDDVASSSSLGHIPLHILTPVISFSLQVGSKALNEIEKDAHTEDLSQMIGGHLRLGLNAVREKNYPACTRNGLLGERIGFSILLTKKCWPEIAYREAHTCCAIIAAIGLVRFGNFVPAMQLLDKTVIFGLPRDRLNAFFSYVEINIRSDNCTESRYASNGMVWKDDHDRDVLIQKGLLCSIISPVSEISLKTLDITYFNKSHLRKRKSLVIRDFASSWPAIETWR